MTTPKTTATAPPAADVKLIVAATAKSTKAVISKTESTLSSKNVAGAVLESPSAVSKSPAADLIVELNAGTAAAGSNSTKFDDEEVPPLVPSTEGYKAVLEGVESFVDFEFPCFDETWLPGQDATGKGFAVDGHRSTLNEDFMRYIEENNEEDE